MLPWRNVAKKVHYVYCEQDGSYDLDKFKEIIKNHSGRSLLALSSHSNVFGRNIRYREMCNIAKQNDIYVMLDATQMLAHERIDVVDSNVDFMAFSAHKLYGPMGVGALYVKKDHFNFLKPSNVGGGSVANVTETDFTLLPRSESFEPGTMNIGGAIGFGVAMDYLTKNSTEIVALEKDIAKYAYDTLSRIQHLRVVSRPDDVIISFTMDDIHPHDIAQYLNTFKICVRAGYHCAQPGLDYLGIGPVTRVSLCFYNTKPEIDTLVGVLQKIYKEMKLDV